MASHLEESKGKHVENIENGFLIGQKQPFVFKPESEEGEDRMVQGVARAQTMEQSMMMDRP